MKRAALLLTAVVVAIIVYPDFRNGAAASPDGFTPLFNGENLDGWVGVNTAPETWSVRDGMIVCTGFPTGVLRTTEQYQNFILELEWRHVHEGGNAGVFVHSDPIPVRGQPFTRAIEMQVMEGNHGDVFPIQGATMTPIVPHPGRGSRALPTEERSKPAGEWNHYRVESRDGMVSLAVNGKVVSQGVNTNPRKGYITLESEGSEVHFRNIRIKELPGEQPPPDVVAEQAQGFESLYNGLDLRGWKDLPGDEEGWQANDWILDYDGQREAEGIDRSLWTEREFNDFVLIVDWRQPAEPELREVPNVLPDGSLAETPDGSQLAVTVPDAGDSGIYLRGSTKAQINIWNWPIGSGEIYGYRTDQSMPSEVRAGATPLVKADRPIGDWNRFEITMIDDRVSVVLNGQTVIRDAHLPGVPESGPIGLQDHGDPMQFANIYIKELD